MATKDSRLSRAGVSAYNQPKRTPSHPTKSHVVVAKQGDAVKTIRFGQQGVQGSPDGSKRNEAFKARVCHRPQPRNGQIPGYSLSPLQFNVGDGEGIDGHLA